MKSLIAVLVLVDVLFVSVSSSAITLTNNRYSGIVIAINPSVGEDSSLIESIKKAWNEASPALFTATRSRAYFGDITILIPSSWNSVPYDEISIGESYDEADIVVTDPNPSYGDAPYTVQYGGCGSQGSYIHLTPDYLKEDYISNNFGPRGKVIVHEWAHYRWGVFDETDSSQPFYDDPSGNTLTNLERSLSYTQCAKDIEVCCLDVSDSNIVARCIPGRAECRINEATGVFYESCVCYLPNNAASGGSIMAYQYADHIDTFCDDTVGSTREHNRNAPNDQNRLCDLRSTWSVIMDSVDFNGANNANPAISNLSPTFTVKKVERNKRFVLVLDVSGSMGTAESTGETRLEIANKAAANFINSVADGSLVGIVSFSTYSSTNAYLTLVDSQGSRDSLIQKVPTTSGGSTCIGCGIDEAIDVLERHSNPAGGYIIVMTDGQGTLDDSVVTEALTKKVIVQTLIIYTKANQALVDLSEESGGAWFFASSDDLLALFSAYDDFADPKDGDLSSKKYEVYSDTFALNPSDPPYQSTINIDSTIGNETTFTYAWSFGTNAPSVTLLPPPVNSCGAISSVGSSSCAIVTKDQANKLMTISILGIAQVGSWTSIVGLATGDAQTVTVVVNSKASGIGGDPIIVESVLEMKDGNPLVYAKVTQGLNPVLGAQVTASVSVQTGNGIEVALYDGGADPDIRRNDGIYSRYITGIGTGRYSVKVKVESEYGGYDGNTKTSFSKATYNPGYYMSNGTVVSNPNGATFLPRGSSFGVSAKDLGNFTRQAPAGAFDFTAVGTADTTPPSKVLDLIVSQNDLTDFSKGVVLSFTSPGDDFDSGIATRYEIRYAVGSSQDLVNNFAAATLVVSGDVLEGDISNPQAAGTRENFVISIPTVGTPGSISVGFALKSFDEENNEAPVSNIANLRYFIDPPSFAIPGTTFAIPGTTAAATTVAVTTSPLVTTAAATTVAATTAAVTTIPLATTSTLTTANPTTQHKATTIQSSTPDATTFIPTTADMRTRPQRATTTISLEEHTAVSNQTTSRNDTSNISDNTSVPSVEITTQTPCKDCGKSEDDLLWLWITLGVLVVGGGAAAGILIWIKHAMCCRAGTVEPENIEI